MPKRCRTLKRPKRNLFIFRPLCNLQLIAHSYECFHNNSNGLNCNCDQTEEVDYQIYISLVIGSRFKWVNHINNVCDKLRPVTAIFSIIYKKIAYYSTVSVVMGGPSSLTYIIYTTYNYESLKQSYPRKLRLILKITTSCLSFAKYYPST